MGRGLLGKVASMSDPCHNSADPPDIQSAINGFYKDHPLFHCVLLGFNSDPRQGICDVAEIIAPHGAACFCLRGGNGLVLLPGRLDMELFSHQLSRSTGSAVLFQFSANSPSLALDTLGPYLR